MMNVSDRTYHLLSTAVIALFLVSAFLTLPDYGMGWDEQVRWRSGDRKLEYYGHLLAGDFEGTKSTMQRDKYPGLFDLPLAMFHKTFGGNRMIQGHVWSILFGALGIISIAWLGSIVFSNRVGFFSALCLCLLPLFYGHSMMNPKDIPFMATYTLGLAAVLSIARRIECNSGELGWKHYLLCGIAIGLAASSRVPGFVLVPLGAVVWFGIHISQLQPMRLNRQTFRSLIPIFSGILTTAVAAFSVLMIFFPRAQLQLFSSLPSVTSALHSSADSLPLLFAGKMMNAGEGPLFYAHLFVLISTPIWMLGFGGLGLYRIGKAAISLFKAKCPPPRVKTAFLMLAAFPWIYILITHPALHDGARHMLFAFPPLIIFVALGLDHLISMASFRSGALRFAPSLVITACIVFQLHSLYRMHPYQYVSFNVFAGPRESIPNRYETEYWCTSTKHLLDALPSVIPNYSGRDLSKNPVRIRVSGALDAATIFIPENFILVDSFDQAEYYLANTYCRSDLLAEGEEIFRIERGGIPIAVIKKLHP